MSVYKIFKFDVVAIGKIDGRYLYQVNDMHLIDTYIVIEDSALGNDMNLELIKQLKLIRALHLSRFAHFDSFEIDSSNEDVIYVDFKGKPVCKLQKSS